MTNLKLETVSSEDNDKVPPPPMLVATVGLRVRGEDVGLDDKLETVSSEDDNEAPPSTMVVATVGLRVTGEDVGFLADLDDKLVVSSEDDNEAPPPPMVVTTGLRVRGEDVGFLADFVDKLETVSSEDDDEAPPPLLVVLEQDLMTSHACCHAPPYTVENGSNPTWLQNAATPVNLHLKIFVFMELSFIDTKLPATYSAPATHLLEHPASTDVAAVVLLLMLLAALSAMSHSFFFFLFHQSGILVSGT